MDSLGVRVENTFSVGIDLEKALANPGSTANIVLREGDVISIPKNNNTVTINGAVMVPNTVSYIKGEDIDYYLNQCCRNVPTTESLIWDRILTWQM